MDISLYLHANKKSDDDDDDDDDFFIHLLKIAFAFHFSNRTQENKCHLQMFKVYTGMVARFVSLSVRLTIDFL